MKPLIISSFIIGILFWSSVGYKVYSNLSKQSAKSQEVSFNDSYTIDALCRSTLTEKYPVSELWDKNIIKFDNHKYQVVDTKGSRKFVPLENAPPLQLTPAEHRKCVINVSNNTDTEETKIIPSVYNLNNLISCQFPHSGNKMMTQEECNTAIDCEVGNTWIIYSSEQTCREAQKNNLEEELVNYTEEERKLIEKYLNTIQDNSHYIQPTIPQLPTFPSYSNPIYDDTRNENINPTTYVLDSSYLLDMCISNARNRYQQQMAMNRARGNDGSGNLVAERDRDKQIEECKRNYE